MDRGAWWAAVSGVAQSRTRLKRLSSSSSSRLIIDHRSCELDVFFEGNKEYDFLQESFPECTGEI